MKLTKILIIFLIATLPLIHGRLFQTLGLDFGLIVSGNFEFTKSMYFNVVSSIIIIVFFIEHILLGGNRVLVSQKEKYICTALCIIFCISTYFSLSPFTSLIGDLEKGHTFLLFTNLLGLYLVIRQFDSANRRFIINSFLFSGVLVSILAIKEFYYPSFDYGNLSNRAMGSLGHPNYLSGYILLVFVFVQRIRNQFIKILISGLFIWTIVLCQSLVALSLCILYLCYTLSIGARYISRTYFIISVILLLSGAAVYIIAYFPEKIHSLISRWYIWETTLKIIFSDIKIILLGAGLETLPYYFSSYKVPEIYIFENFGFTADRPHSFILNIFYHLGLAGLSIFTYFTYLFYKYISVSPSRDKTISIYIITLFLLYGVFHYFSIASYLLLVAGICMYFHKHHKKNSSGILLFMLIALISLVGSTSSIRLYIAEIHYEKSQYTQALKLISHPKYLLSTGDISQAVRQEGIISQQNIKKTVIKSQDAMSECKVLIDTYPSVENYFYCAEKLENLGNVSLAKIYYQDGINKLPDLWNKDSPYWQKYFVKHTITGNRFFSPKFGDINSVLEKIER